MRFVRSAVLSALALLATVAAATAATDSDLKSKIVGAWGSSADCSQGSLVFKANGSFASKPPAGAELDGTYSIVKGVLAGVAGPVTMPAMAVSFDSKGELVLIDSSDPTNPDMLVRCK